MAENNTRTPTPILETVGHMSMMVTLVFMLLVPVVDGIFEKKVLAALGTHCAIVAAAAFTSVFIRSPGRILMLVNGALWFCVASVNIVTLTLLK